MMSNGPPQHQQQAIIPMPPQEGPPSITVGKVPMEWSEVYLREFLSMNNIIGVQYCTIMGPRPGMPNHCTALLRFQNQNLADRAANLLPQLSFKDQQGYFTSLEVLPSNMDQFGGGGQYVMVQQHPPPPANSASKRQPPWKDGYNVPWQENKPWNEDWNTHRRNAPPLIKEGVDIMYGPGSAFPMQGQPMQGQPMQGQPMQSQPMQSQPMHGQSMHSQSMQGHPLPPPLYETHQYNQPPPGPSYVQQEQPRTEPPLHHGMDPSSQNQFNQIPPPGQQEDSTWDSSGLRQYLEQATTQIRDNLAKGMVPTSSQLEKYVQKLVDRMQMKMKQAPFTIWDAASQFFFPFWGFVSNSRIRDPSIDEVIGVLEQLMREIPGDRAAKRPRFA